MKKFFIIIFILIFSTTVYANEQEELFEEFNIWLAKNEFTEYYKVGFAEPFNDIATNRAIVVFPTPLGPANKNA